MVPTLVVPLQKTLSEDVESRYRAITESKVGIDSCHNSRILTRHQAIIEFLDKSRSPWSQTHTTSQAPAPSLTPATIAFTETSAEMIELVHTDEVDPNNLRYMNARDTDSLKSLAREMLPALHTRRDVLSKYISNAGNGTIQVSEKVTALWEEKKAATEVLLGLYKNADVSESALDPEERSKRAEYFEMAKCARASLGRTLLRVEKDIIGPFALGKRLQAMFRFINLNVKLIITSCRRPTFNCGYPPLCMVSEDSQASRRRRDRRWFCCGCEIATPCWNGVQIGTEGPIVRVLGSHEGKVQLEEGVCGRPALNVLCTILKASKTILRLGLLPWTSSVRSSTKSLEH